jgi:hypothetical protein
MISRVVQYWNYGTDNDFCVEYFDNPFLRKVYTLSLFILLYSIPLFVIGLSYYLMARTLWNSVSPGFLRDNTARALRARKRVSKMILVIVTAFAICWLPIHCVQLHSDFGTPSYTVTHDIIKIVAHVLSYVNSALNPIIYAFMSENFRKYSRIACSGICQMNGKPPIRRNVFTVVDHEILPVSNSSGSRQTGNSSIAKNKISLRFLTRLKTTHNSGGSRTRESKV